MNFRFVICFLSFPFSEVDTDGDGIQNSDGKFFFTAQLVNEKKVQKHFNFQSSEVLNRIEVWKYQTISPFLPKPDDDDDNDGIPDYRGEFQSRN